MREYVNIELLVQCPPMCPAFSIVAKAGKDHFSRFAYALNKYIGSDSLSLPPLKLYAVLLSPALTSLPLTVADHGFISSERYVLAPVHTRLSNHLLFESQLQIQSYCSKVCQSGILRTQMPGICGRRTFPL